MWSKDYFRLVFVIIKISGILFVGITKAPSQTLGVWERRDPLIDGSNGLSVIYPDDLDPNKIYAGTSKGMYISDDFGLTWRQSSNSQLNDTRISSLISKDEAILAGTSSGIFRSTDGGTSWVQTLFTNNDVSHLVVVDETIFAGGFGVYYSTDGGINWIQPHSPIKGEWISILMAVNNTLYAGTQDHGVFWSSDGGDNWTQSNAPMNNKWVRTLTSIDGVLIAGTNIDGMFRSTDGGTDWVQSSTISNGSSVSSVIVVNNVLVTGLLLLNSRIGGIYRSYDKGVTWIPSLEFQQIRTLFQVDGTLYAGTPFDGTLWSKNDGVDWTRAEIPLSDYMIRAIYKFRELLFMVIGATFLRSDNNGNSWVHLRLTRRATGFYGLYVAPDLLALYNGQPEIFGTGIGHELGVYISHDGGSSWEAPPPPISDLFVDVFLQFQGVLIAGTNEDGIFYSEDKGRSWLQPTYENTTVSFSDKFVEAILAVGDKVYVGTSGGLFYSTSKGRSWVRANSPLDRKQTVRLHFDGKVLYAVGNVQGHSELYYSTNGGADWSLSTLPIENASIQTLISHDKKLYAGLYKNGVIFSTDAGMNWIQSNAPLNDKSVKSLIAVDNTLYAGGCCGNDGIFQSNDDGLNWTQIKTPRTDVFSFISALNSIYVGTSDGIYRKSAAGKLWRPLNKNLTQNGRPRILDFAYIPDLKRLVTVTPGGLYSQTLDIAPPVADSMLVNLGAEFTNGRKVSVNLFVKSADADSVNLAESSTFDFNSTGWQEYNINKNFMLSNGDGLKTVYANFKDFSWNVSDTINSQIILDTTSPSFLVHSPQEDASIGNTVTVEQQVIEENLKGFYVDYRRVGETWSQNRRTFFENNIASIDGVFITNRGIDYRITAEDFAGHTSTLANGEYSFFSIPVNLNVGDLGSSPSFTGGTKGSAYRLISIPMKLEGSPNVKAVLGNLGEYGEKGDWRFWQYQSNGQWREGENLNFKNGEAYFIILRNVRSFTNKVSGTTMPTTAGLTKEIPGWHLRANEWNIIGNPYKTRIDLAQLKLSRQGFSLSAHDTLNQLDIWKYDGSATRSGWTKDDIALEPWSGLAIRVSEADTIVFTNKDEPYAPVLAKPSSSPPLLTQNLQEDEWVFKIAAASEGYVDEFNYFGVKNDASETQDRYEWLEPPLAPGGISVSFPHPEWSIPTNLATDFRATREPGHIWLARLIGRSGEMTEVRFESTGKIPDDVQIYLIDEDTQITSDLREKSEFAFRVQEHKGFKQLRIVAGMPEFIEREIGSPRRIPDQFALHQNYPNPFNPSTVIRYELPFAGKVTLKLFNVMGREVLTVQDGEFHEPGYYEQVLDMSEFASGIYFYKIAVDSEHKFQQTRKLVFTK